MFGWEFNNMPRTTVKATCNLGCGDVTLTTADVVVRICTDTGEGEYRFKCPKCNKLVVKNASPPILNLLEESGVKKEEWQLPQELFELREGPVITLDDIIDFHEELERGLDLE